MSCCRALLFAVLLSLAPVTAGATLIGDSIDGSIEFSGFAGITFFDPANGQVPPPPASSGIQPSAIVTDPVLTFPEFVYSDGACEFCVVNIHLDVDANSIILREFLIDPAKPASNLLGWDVWITNVDFGGVPVGDVTSSDFIGLTASFTTDSVHLSYAGGDDIDPLSMSDPRTERVVVLDFIVLPIPEPSTATLVVGGLLFLAGRARR